MNKAAFKALREHTGLSHAVIADTLGVNERSVKCWEDPRYSDPPEDACRIVREARGSTARDGGSRPRQG